MRMVLVGCMVLLAGVGGCRKEDYSTPRAAARTFYEALLGGDNSVAQSALADPGQGKVIGDLQTMLQGLIACQDAAEKRFGASGDGVSSGLPSLDDIESASELIRGEDATLTPAQKGLRQVRLKRVGGLWKLDLLGSLGLPGGNVELAQQIMRSVGKSADSVRQGIEAGRYASATAAQADLEHGVTRAVMSGVIWQLHPGG